jgi:hypothetical protein
VLVGPSVDSTVVERYNFSTSTPGVEEAARKKEAMPLPQWREKGRVREEEMLHGGSSRDVSKTTLEANKNEIRASRQRK